MPKSYARRVTSTNRLHSAPLPMATWHTLTGRAPCTRMGDAVATNVGDGSGTNPASIGLA